MDFLLNIFIFFYENLCKNNRMSKDKDLILREEGFILDCESVKKSRLPAYNPFNDRYMGYMLPIQKSSH